MTTSFSKVPFQLPLGSSLGNVEALRSSWNLLFCRLNIPTLSVCLHSRGFPAFSALSGLLCSHSNRSLSFLCWGPQSRWGFTRMEVRWKNPLPWPAGHAVGDAAQDAVGILGCQCTLLGHVQFLIHPVLSVLLSIPLSPGLGAGPCSQPCWTSQGSHGCTPRAGPSGGISSLRCIYCTTGLGTITGMGTDSWVVSSNLRNLLEPLPNYA